MKIVLLAGGSGGHISPALAVSSEIKKSNPSAKCIFLCSRNTLDKDIFLRTGEKFIPIFSGKIRRYFSWQNFIDPFFLIVGFFQSLFLFLKNRPDVIFSKGGFVAVPPALAAFFLRIPILVHESDSVPGLANRFVQNFSQKILTTFPLSFGKHVGTPIRNEVFTANPQKGCDFLNFEDQEKPMIFGFGGSQGSYLLNTYFIHISKNLSHLANFVWITGKEESREFPIAKNIRIFEYLQEEYFHVLSASDLVISRAGSNSIFEIATLKKPMLLIPLASSAGNHQEKNAEYFASSDLAEVLLEKDINKDILQKTITSLICDKNKRKKMKDASKNFKLKNSASVIAHSVLFIGGKKNSS